MKNKGIRKSEFVKKNSMPLAFKFGVIWNGRHYLGGDLSWGWWHQGSLRMLPAVWHKEAGLSPCRRNWWSHEVKELQVVVLIIYRVAFQFTTVTFKPTEID